MKTLPLSLNSFGILAATCAASLLSIAVTPEDYTRGGTEFKVK